MTPLRRIALVATTRAVHRSPYKSRAQLREFGEVYLTLWLHHFAHNYLHAWNPRDFYADIAAASLKTALEIVGEPVAPASTPEQAAAFELSETMARTDTSSRIEDRPVLPSQVVSDFEARRARELLALRFRSWKQRRAA
jgi:hypothetical protein